VLIRTFLTLCLTLDLCASGSDLTELTAAQKGRRDSVEESLRTMAQSCPPGSPKWKEAAILYRRAQERSNTFLDGLVLDVRKGTLRKDYSAQAQESEAAAIQTQTYLDTALCDGKTTQGRFIMALPLLLKLCGALSSSMDGFKGYKWLQTRQDAERKKLVGTLESMRWRPMEECLPLAGGGVRATAGKGLVEGDVPFQAPDRAFRLETGFHTAPIRQAALDPGGKYLATVSEDKTVRLFDPATLEPVRVLRPPTGPEDSGKLYALALAPDGTWAAVSGFTGEAGSGSHRIYILDTRDGHLMQTIAGLPQVVNALSLSADGATLIAHLGGRQGLRAYHLPDGAEVARDPNFLAPTYAGAFAPDGRYAASCDDGYLRLYGPGLKLQAKMKAPAGSPFGVAFNGDGTLLAVGYADGCRVDVLNGKNLMPAAKPDLAGTTGPLATVAWSRDGRTLYAAGGEDFGAKANPVYRWDESGKGRRQELAVGAATVSALVPCADGGLVVACQDPQLARLGADFKVAARRAVQNGELRMARSALKLDPTGAMVALDWRGPEGGAFSIPMLDRQTPPPGALTAAVTAGGLRIEGWQDQEHPTLDGKPLEGLQPHEVVRSLSLAPGGAGFALGTDWFLRLYDGQGRAGAVVPLPAACWGVNHARDGRILVAALADGTVRWFNRETAEPLMGLYAADDRRWILWNARGYYCAGVGGETLAGWQVHREGEAGDFFPVAHFRGEADQPKLFPLLLQTGSFRQAALQLRLPVAPEEGPAAAAPAPGRVLPPVIQILEPVDGATVEPGTVEFRVAVRTWVPGDAVESFRVTVDGQKLSALRGIPPRMVARSPQCQETHFTLKLPMPDRDCRIGLAVETGQGQSDPAEVYLKPARGLLKENLDPNRAVAFITHAPSLNILAVGVGTYKDPGLKLRFPAKDARDVTEVFRRQQNGLYANVQVTLLTDAQATRNKVMEALRQVRDHSDPAGVTLVFISGHGLTNTSQSSYCFLPYDAGVDPEVNLIDGREIRDTLNGADGKVILFLDTCHAGNVMGGGQLRGLEDLIHLTRLINELSSAQNGVTVFSSSTGRQLSLESADWENGAFTRALKEGLGGKADPKGQGKVTVDMLDAYLRTRVKELTQGLQTPVSGHPSGASNYPLVVVKAGG